MTAKQPAPAKAIKKKTAVPPKPKGKPGKPGERRLTAEQKREALQICIQLLSEMEHPTDIVQIIAKKYGIKDRQCREYICEARQKMQEQVDREMGSCLANAIIRLKTLKRKVDQEGDRKTQLGVEREINRLLLPAKLEVTGAAGGPIQTQDLTPRVELTPEKLYAAVQILRRAEGKTDDQAETD